MLRANQRLISKIIVENDAKMIISGMGSGKTGATLDAIHHLRSTFQVHRVLVIAPWFVAKNTWPDEIEAWSHTRTLSYAVCVGDPEERIAALEADAEITTINFENLQWLAKHLGTADNWVWDMVIVDESSRLSAGEPRTKTTKVKTVKDGKVVVKVRKGGRQTRFGIMTIVRRKIDRIVELTGTPGDIKKLWGQSYLLDQGSALGRSKPAFEKEFFVKDQDSHTEYQKPGAEAEVLRRMGTLAVTIPEEKLVPDPHFYPLNVRLPDKAMQQYKDFERTLYADEWDVLAVSRGVLANKLLQAANGSIYREDRSVVAIHDEKIRALEELIEQANGESILTWYSFQFDIEKLQKRWPEAVVANKYRGDLVGDWNKGRIKHLLAHPNSIGHGTNMQDGGHIMAWYGMTFSLELWQQANKRLPRPGQTKQVLIYPIVALGTYDEKALKSLNAKDATQARIIEHFMIDKSSADRQFGSTGDEVLV